MIRRVRVLGRAQADVEEIARYVALDAPSSAKKLVARLLDAMESLAHAGERGAIPRDERLRALGFRYLVVGSHLLFYKVVAKQIRIYRVVHSRRAYEHVL